MAKNLSCLSNRKVAILGINSFFGRLSAFLLKQSPHIKQLALYDECDTSIASDIAYINTHCKVEAFEGENNLSCAIQNADVILIGDSKDKQNICPNVQLEEEGKYIIDYADAIADHAKNTIVLLAASPMNSLLPLLSQVLIDRNVYNADKILGVTAADNMRANKLVADFLKIDPKKVVLPIVGGSSPDTRVPLFTQVRPFFNVSKKQWQTFTSDIKNSELEILRLKGICETVNKAYATVRFIHSVLLGLEGKPNIVEIAFARTLLVPGCHYFSLPVILGESGIKHRFSLPLLNKPESLLVNHAVKCLNLDAEKGLEVLCKSKTQSELSHPDLTGSLKKGINFEAFLKKIKPNCSSNDRKQEYSLMLEKVELTLQPENKSTGKVVDMVYVESDSNPDCCPTVLPKPPSIPRQLSHSFVNENQTCKKESKTYFPPVDSLQTKNCNKCDGSIYSRIVETFKEMQKLGQNFLNSYFLSGKVNDWSKPHNRIYPTLLQKLNCKNPTPFNLEQSSGNDACKLSINNNSLKDHRNEKDSAGGNYDAINSNIQCGLQPACTRNLLETQTMCNASCAEMVKEDNNNKRKSNKIIKSESDRKNFNGLLDELVKPKQDEGKSSADLKPSQLEKINQFTPKNIPARKNLSNFLYKLNKMEKKVTQNLPMYKTYYYTPNSSENNQFAKKKSFFEKNTSQQNNVLTNEKNINKQMQVSDVNQKVMDINKSNESLHNMKLISDKTVDILNKKSKELTSGSQHKMINLANNKETKKTIIKKTVVLSMKSKNEQLPRESVKLSVHSLAKESDKIFEAQHKSSVDSPRKTERRKQTSKIYFLKSVVTMSKINKLKTVYNAFKELTKKDSGSSLKTNALSTKTQMIESHIIQHPISNVIRRSAQTAEENKSSKSSVNATQKIYAPKCPPQYLFGQYIQTHADRSKYENYRVLYNVKQIASNLIQMRNSVVKRNATLVNNTNLSKSKVVNNQILNSENVLQRGKLKYLDAHRLTASNTQCFISKKNVKNPMKPAPERYSRIYKTRRKVTQ